MTITQDRIVQSLLELVQAFRAAGIPFAIAGAHAVAIHGHPRATRDVDLLLRSDDRESAHRLMQRLGYERTNDSGPFMSYERTPLPELAGLREVADLLMSSRETGHRAIEEAQRNPVQWHGEPVPVVGLNTLILMKTMAFAADPRRIQDVADIAKLMESNRGALDIGALRAGADSMGPDVRKQLDALLGTYALAEPRTSYAEPDLRL
jgi:hypothetical protein